MTSSRQARRSSGIALALDKPGFLKAVDDPAQCDRFDIKDVGQLDLPQARVAAEAEQDLPLGARDSQRRRTAIEGPAQGMGRLGNFKWKCLHSVRI